MRSMSCPSCNVDGPSSSKGVDTVAYHILPDTMYAMKNTAAILDDNTLSRLPITSNPYSVGDGRVVMCHRDTMNPVYPAIIYYSVR